MGIIGLVFFCICVLLVLLVVKYSILPSLSYDPPSFKVLLSTKRRDLRVIMALFNLHMITYYYFHRDLSVPKIFRKLSKKHPDKVCFIFNDKKWTFQQVEDYSNQVANAFIKAGYRKGNEVALLMNNCPEYACIWLGLSKIGVVTALINSNLRMHSLAHCINIVSVKAIIFGAEFFDAVHNAAPLLKNQKCQYYCFGDLGDRSSPLPIVSLDEILKNESKKMCPSKEFRTGYTDKLLYLYTSGTTGFPKAAIVKNRRYLLYAAALKTYGKLRNDDIVYNILPLHHAVGGMLYLSNSLILGNTTVIKKKFSAKEYWADVIKYKVTIGVSIGEICRFLLHQAVDPFEKSHNIRLIFTTGLRQQIWTDFVERFSIPQIVEIYGTTEGTVPLVNFFGKPGSLGLLPQTFSKFYPMNIIRVDLKTEEPIRNGNGLCIICKPGELGVMVGKAISEHYMLTCDGYIDQEESKKKIVQDCLTKGDQVFFTGDLVVMDEEGCVYFKDRVGDNFRWRGENVSTNEVEMVISKLLDLTPCVVFGIEIPGTEGRSGMAVIQSDQIMEMKILLEKLQNSLPSYALPVFIRFCRTLQLTSTFKFIKGDLQREGYNVEKIEDPIFFLDPSRQEYVRLDADSYKNIREGKHRL